MATVYYHVFVKCKRDPVNVDIFSVSLMLCSVEAWIRSTRKTPLPCPLPAMDLFPQGFQFRSFPSVSAIWFWHLSSWILGHYLALSPGGTKRLLPFILIRPLHSNMKGQSTLRTPRGKFSTHFVHWIASTVSLFLFPLMIPFCYLCFYLCDGPCECKTLS